MLIGRRFLAGDFIVDPSVTYTQDPTCDEEEDNKADIKKENKDNK